MWVLTWGWPHPLLLGLSSFESPSHEDQDSVNKKRCCSDYYKYIRWWIIRLLELLNESTYMKSKNRICMKNFHQPQQQLFVLLLVRMQLIFLVPFLFHFVDLQRIYITNKHVVKVWLVILKQLICLVTSLCFWILFCVHAHISLVC